MKKTITLTFCLCFITTQAFGHAFGYTVVRGFDNHFSLEEVEKFQTLGDAKDALENAKNDLENAIDDKENAEKITAAETAVKEAEKKVEAAKEALNPSRRDLEEKYEAPKKASDEIVLEEGEYLTDEGFIVSEEGYNLLKTAKEEKAAREAEAARLKKIEEDAAEAARLKKIADDEAEATRVRIAAEAEEARLRAIPVVVPVDLNPNPCARERRPRQHFDFVATPRFTDLRVGTIQSGTYTITNCCPVPVDILIIEIKGNDALPEEAIEIVTAPTNSCVVGADLGSGASCNIQVNLRPLTPGTYNRKLRVAFNTRQVDIFGPSITVTAR